MRDFVSHTGCHQWRRDSGRRGSRPARKLPAWREPQRERTRSSASLSKGKVSPCDFANSFTSYRLLGSHWSLPRQAEPTAPQRFFLPPASVPDSGSAGAARG